MKLPVLMMLLSSLMWGCGEEDIERPDFTAAPHRGGSDARALHPFLVGQTVPQSVILDQLVAAIEGQPQQSDEIRVSVLAEGALLSRITSPAHFVLCGESMELAPAKVDAEQLAKDLEYARSWAISAGINAKLETNDYADSMKIYLTNSASGADCTQKTFGIASLDTFNVLSDDIAIIFVDSLPEDRTVGEAMAHALAMMTGHSELQKSDLAAEPFDAKPYAGQVQGTALLRGVNAGLPSLDAESVVSIAHLDAEIRQIYSPGIQGLPDIDKVLSLVTMAGSNADDPQKPVDPKSAVNNLTDAFVDNAGTISTLATLVGHPEVAVGVSVVAAILGGKNAGQSPTNETEPEPVSNQTYLPDLAAMMELTATNHAELLHDYESIYAFIERNYQGANFNALVSLLKLAAAQKAASLVVAP